MPTSPALSAPPEPAADLQCLIELTGCEDRVLLQPVIEDFLAEGTLAQGHFEQPASLGRLNELRAIAHRFVSCANYVGARPLAEALEALEGADDAIGADELDLLLQRIGQAWQHAAAEVRRWRLLPADGGG